MTKRGNGPQKENGFTAIANEIVEQLALAPISRDGFRCVMFLLRKTYGYQKKTDRISLAQWSEGTGLKRQNVWRALQQLQEQRIVFSTDHGVKSAKTWGFNKHYEQWFAESVIAGDDSLDSQSVIAGDDRCEPSVIAGDDKSVINSHEHTKERKKVVAAAAAESSLKNEFVTAYEQTWGRLVESPYVSDTIRDWSERVTIDAWRYALRESADANARNWKYLTRILERVERDGFVAPTTTTQPAPVIDLTLEDIYGHR